jgi:hypothetical protein
MTTQDKTRANLDWLLPLMGVLAIVIIVSSFAVGGEPPSADEGGETVANWYVDNQNQVQIAALMSVIGGVLVVFFFAYLRTILQSAEGEGGTLSLLALIGAAIIAVAAAIESTIAFAIAEAADDIDPASVQSLQALFENDFIPFVLGSAVLWLSVGITTVLHGVLPKWLGWVAVVLGVVSLTPVGFVSFPLGALWIVVVSILLSLRGRVARATPAPPAAAAA